VRRTPPEELTVEVELDPPVDRVDAAAFAARGLAERLHRTLASHGLSCTRLGVVARTVGGEELRRVWRCAEPLTPSGTVDRVRWQLDAWLSRGGAGAVARLWLVPEETVTAGALQLGLWGDVGEADERAGRALVRVQALLGPESVVTAVLVGGRDPAGQIRFVPWGDDRDLGLAAPAVHPGAGEPVGRGDGDTADGDPAAGPAAGWGAPEPGGVGVSRIGDRRSGAVGFDPGGEPGPGGAGPGQGAHRPEPWGGEQPGPAGSAAGSLVAPAGWPDDVVRRTGRVAPVGQAADSTGGEPKRPTNRRRRVAVPRSSTGRAAVPDAPPSWPGRAPAPSPAVVPPQPLPAELIDAAGRPVRLTTPDLLSAPPVHVVVDGGEPQPVVGWAGVWPVRQRWWASDGVEAGRLQVDVSGGAPLLLLAREGRWWVTGVYD
jgi:protein ImuB